MSKTPEELKVYQHQYYMDHKGIYYQKYCEWRKTHPENIAASHKQWRKRNPAYYRDYMRKRVAVVDPFIFEFLDGGFGRSVEEYTDYLRSQSVSEQHINWFKKDLQKCMGCEE